MYYDYFDKKKDEIKKEIEALEKKKKQLRNLELEYYRNFYDSSYRIDYRGRELDYVLLQDCPHNPTNRKHILYDYSVFNVDTIGKIICQLLKTEGINFISERLYETEISDNIFHDRLYYPVLVIGKKDEVYELSSNESNIIIRFDYNATLDKYPTKNPVIWNLPSQNGPLKKSNYSHLINYKDGLSFDCPIKQEDILIRQLIYSLSYYQKQHNIKQMTPSDTWDVYRKIYYKK